MLENDIVLLEGTIRYFHGVGFLSNIGFEKNKEKTVEAAVNFLAAADDRI